MPIEIAMPFRISADGGIAVETNPDRQINQHIASLVGTAPSERVMLPEYGVALDGLLFDPNSDITETEVTEMVAYAMSQWEPGVALRGVTPVGDADGYGVATVEVDFVRTGSARTTSTRMVNRAVIGIGGDVREDIRG